MENPNPKAVGLRLRAAVRKLGMSIEEAAKTLAVPRNVLSNWLNGYVLPRHASMRELTRLLPGLTIEWIIWGDDRLVPLQLATELAIFVEAFKQKLELPEVQPEPESPAPGGHRARRKQVERAA